MDYLYYYTILSLPARVVYKSYVWYNRENNINIGGILVKTKFYLLSFTFAIVLSALGICNIGIAQASSYNSAKLADDPAFINVDAMSVNQIQDLLRSNGSFLKNYSEDGRTAAQIIYDAAHGHGDASALINGIDIHKTINPVAILAVLQKEQSLVTMVDKNQDVLNVAMGYACPDSGGCDAKYKGFTKQVENASWQLRYNYERASGNGFSDFQVAQKINIDGKTITISNRSTAALYRYTPHLGTNFTTYFNKWNKAGASISNDGKTYNAVPSSLKLSTKIAKPGQKVTVTMTYKNTGTAVWYNNGDNPVSLGTQNPENGASVLLNGGNRDLLQVSNIKHDKKGLFNWTFTAPSTPGTYSVTLQLVAEHSTWFGPTKTITITVK